MVFNSLMGTLLAVFIGISFEGIHSGSNLSVTVGTVCPALVARHLLWVFYLCSWSCLGFALYSDASLFVDVAEVLLCCLN